MERDLRELTMASMLKKGYVQFYYRAVDYEKLEDWEYDISIDIELDWNLRREQIFSNMLYDLTLNILRVSGNEIKTLKRIEFFDYEGITIHFSDDTRIYIENDIVLKGAYKFVKGYGFRKKDLFFNNLKGSLYWEAGLGRDLDFDCGDKRICCNQFLLQSVIQVIEGTILDKDIALYIG